ncbi:MAG: hypothetical protein EOM58_11270, partial [Clostridia bacterium]|nr:hypothetical protein [Clostridia bacterium]
YMPDDALTCDHCGTLLSEGRPKETGVGAMRQGRVNAIPPVLNDQPRSHVPEYGDYEMSSIPLQPERGMRQKPVGKGLDSFASRPSTHRGVPVRTSEQARHIHTKRGTYRPVKRHSVNWMLIGVILVGLGILAAAGYWVYMSRTDEGQRATAQKIVAKTTDEALLLATNTDPLVKEQHDEALKQLNKASAQSYWLVGQDEMDIGDVETAIMSYRIADLLDPENYDGLLLLGTAYELNSQDDKAEELYLRLAQTVSPSRSESYTALIRMYQEQERRPEAADMMKLAYENTDKENFRLLRKDYIPLQAEVDLAAGRYELTQEINITSPQGYDIYYTTDDAAELPAGGQLVEGPLHLNEGTVNLRAVCVSGDLSSDPISVTYVIYYPSPAAPRANLAPNTYSKPKTVSLRNGEGDEKEELTIYYTIDGSYPDENSPVYDGNPIKLP